jgi:hypothetical protein
MPYMVRRVVGSDDDVIRACRDEAVDRQTCHILASLGFFFFLIFDLVACGVLLLLTATDSASVAAYVLPLSFFRVSESERGQVRYSFAAALGTIECAFVRLLLLSSCLWYRGPHLFGCEY